MSDFGILLATKGIMIGSIYALISLGFNVIYRTTGILNFAQGEFVMLGSILAAWIYAMGASSLFLSMLGGMVGAGVIGFLVEKVAIQPVHKAGTVIQVIVTVGLSIILRAATALIWGTEPFHLPPVQAGAFQIGQLSIDYQNLWILVTAAISMLSLVIFYRLTRTGKAMRACAENAAAAQICGVSPRKMSSLAFCLSASLAGLAGILLTPMLSMRFDQGTMLGLKGFAAAILGGLGHPAGGVFGGLVLGLLEQYSAWYSSVYKEIMALSVVVLILLFKPKGLFQK